MLRKLAIAAPVILATAAVLWSGLNLPPVKWVLKYGLTPGCEPTGDVIPVEDMEFVVIGPGICRVGSDQPLPKVGRLSSKMGRYPESGDLLGRIAQPTGLPWGEPAVPSWTMPVHWVQFPRGFAMARTEVTSAQYGRFASGHSGRELAADGGPPVAQVAWEDAKRYCHWLSEKTGRAPRLPSESEWECMWRVGTSPENAGVFPGIPGDWLEWCEDVCNKSYREWLNSPGLGRRGTTKGRAPNDGSSWLEGENRLRIVRFGWSEQQPGRTAFPPAMSRAGLRMALDTRGD